MRNIGNGAAVQAKSEIVEVDRRSSGEYLRLLGLSEKRRDDLLRYARRYYWLLWVDPVRVARVLAGESLYVVAKTLWCCQLAEFLVLIVSGIVGVGFCVGCCGVC